MPELPEVETMLRGIRTACEGHILQSLQFLPCTRKPITINPDRNAFARLPGHQLDRLERLGKRLLMHFDCDLTMIVEPRMTGLMLVADPPTTEHLRIQMKFRTSQADCTTVLFWDRRGLGTVSLLVPVELQALRDRLGPDALTITTDSLRAALRKTRRAVKPALLDQQLVAGVGNLYASEILHLAGISPRRRCHRLLRREVVQVADATREILSIAVRYEGSTLNDGTYRNALNQDGGYQNHHRVYNREGQLCPTCQQTVIKRIVQAQRSTFFCPGCQH